MPEQEPMFLLTHREVDMADSRQAIAQAALKKVALWLKQHSYHYTPELLGMAPLRHTTYWNSEVWTALMREAGLAQ